MHAREGSQGIYLGNDNLLRRAPKASSMGDVGTLGTLGWQDCGSMISSHGCCQAKQNCKGRRSGTGDRSAGRAACNHDHESCRTTLQKSRGHGNIFPSHARHPARGSVGEESERRRGARESMAIAADLIPRPRSR